MADVVNIDERARINRAEEPDQDVIDVLEWALKEAKAGRARACSVALAMNHSDGGETFVWWSSEAKLMWHLEKMLLGVQILAAEIVEDLRAATKPVPRGGA